MSRPGDNDTGGEGTGEDRTREVLQLSQILDLEPMNTYRIASAAPYPTVTYVHPCQRSPSNIDELLVDGDGDVLTSAMSTLPPSPHPSEHTHKHAHSLGILVVTTTLPFDLMKY